MTVGSLCLEIYLVQRYILHDNWNGIFPINIIMLFILVVLWAYVVRCVARTFIQIFSGEQIDFKKIVKLY